MTCRTVSATMPSSLVADIGGTNIRLALVGADGLPQDITIFPCRDYPDPAAAAEAYLDAVKPPRRPLRAAFGAATAIAGDKVELVNLAWSFSIEDIRRRLGLDRLVVVNDVAALALALPHLGDQDRAPIGGGAGRPGAPFAVVAPGTGLGVAALVRQGNSWLPVASEAGHATVAAHDDAEAAILGILRRRYGHVSAERVLAGPGLVNLYQALCERAGVAAEADMTPAAVSERGARGDCPLCGEAVRLFSAMLGGFAGNVALAFCAWGGLYIGGGVVPRLGPAFDGAAFRQRFAEKGRFSSYLVDVPAFLVTHPTPALIGLAQAV